MSAKSVISTSAKIKKLIIIRKKIVINQVINPKMLNQFLNAYFELHDISEIF